MNIPVSNIYKCIPQQLDKEHLQILAQNENVRIERIISKGHASEKDFWYDQDQDEFVLLLKGKAILGFFEDDKTLSLSAGDYLIIKAHQKHRVTWTDPDTDTFWLTVYF